MLSGQSIRFLDVATGAVQREIKSDNLSKDGRWTDFAVAPQGSRLMIGAVDEQEGSVEVWEIAGPGAVANPSPAKGGEKQDGKSGPSNDGGRGESP